MAWFIWEIHICGARQLIIVGFWIEKNIAYLSTALREKKSYYLLRTGINDNFTRFALSTGATYDSKTTDRIRDLTKKRVLSRNFSSFPASKSRARLLKFLPTKGVKRGDECGEKKPYGYCQSFFPIPVRPQLRRATPSMRVVGFLLHRARTFFRRQRKEPRMGEKNKLFVFWIMWEKRGAVGVFSIDWMDFYIAASKGVVI